MAPQRFSLWLPLKPNKTGVPTQKSRPCETVMAFGSFFLSGTPCWSVGFFFFGKPQEHHPSFVCGSFPDKDSPPIRALERIQISPPPAPAESPPPPQTKTTLGSEQDPGDPMEIQRCPVSSKEASGLYERIPSFCYKETMSKFELLRSTRVAAHALTDPGVCRSRGRHRWRTRSAPSRAWRSRTRIPHSTLRIPGHPRKKRNPG